MLDYKHYIKALQFLPICLPIKLLCALCGNRAKAVLGLLAPENISENDAWFFAQ